MLRGISFRLMQCISQRSASPHTSADVFGVRLIYGSYLCMNAKVDNLRNTVTATVVPKAALSWGMVATFWS
jgi:hypothetical protein